MKTKIHPTYYSDAKVSCASCGKTWKTGSTQEELRVEICSNCHPFYTGKQKIVDTGGRVDKFRQKYGVKQTVKLTLMLFLEKTLFSGDIFGIDFNTFCPLENLYSLKISSTSITVINKLQVRNND